MNQGSNPPSGNSGGKGRRRRRRRGPASHQPNQQHGKPSGQGQGQQHGPSLGQHHGQGKHGGARRFGKKRSGGHKPGGRPAQHEPLGGVYSAPMDHSYRAVLGEHNGNLQQPDRGRAAKAFTAGETAPPPVPV